MTDDEIRLTTSGFAELMLGLQLYDWQAKAVLPLESAVGPGCKRQNIAVVTPNDSGKDNRIIPTAAYWWLFWHKKGRVVITSKSDMQLETQTKPNLNQHWRKFGWSEPINSPRYTLVTPTGGSLVAYVTNDGSRTEGHHSRPGEPLLLIANEAKYLDPSIYEGIDRCTPDVLMELSSPGEKKGRFFDCFTKLAANYTLIRAGLKDCPHIPQEKIDDIILKYGPDHPVTRSTLYGEFMTAPDGDPYCLTPEEWDNAIVSPPQHQRGMIYGFFDFADGRAENVLFLRDGNKYTMADAWREKSEDAVVGRAIYLIRKHHLETPYQVGADAAAKPILDKMANAGFPVYRQNFGAKDKHGIYTSWSAMAWLEGCAKIRNREVIIPNDPTLRAQATTRKKKFAPTGKLGLVDKLTMFREEGYESPDRFDALVGAMSAVDLSLYQSRPQDVFQQQHEERNLEALGGISVGL